MITEEFNKAMKHDGDFFFTFDDSGDIVIAHNMDNNAENRPLTIEEKIYAELIDLDELILNHILFAIEDCSYPRT